MNKRGKWKVFRKSTLCNFQRMCGILTKWASRNARFVKLSLSTAFAWFVASPSVSIASTPPIMAADTRKKHWISSLRKPKWSLACQCRRSRADSSVLGKARKSSACTTTTSWSLTRKSWKTRKTSQTKSSLWTKYSTSDSLRCYWIEIKWMEQIVDLIRLIKKIINSYI